MKKIATLLFLTVALAFAGEPATKAATDTVIQKPNKEQIAKAVALNNTICPITKEKIGSMGMAVPVIYKGKIINLCCGGCPGDFAKDPEKYMKIVNEELAKQKPAPKPATTKMQGMEGMEHKH
jgi:hypothetical protein